MRPFILILGLLISTSCSPVYRQLDTNNKPIATEIITSPDYKIYISIARKIIEDNADYHVYLTVKPLIHDMPLDLGKVAVVLSSYRSGKLYQPVDVKILKEQPLGQRGIWVPPVPTPAETSQRLELKAGKRYAFLYAFSGDRRRILKLDVAAVINGDTIKKTFVFKKHTEVQLFH